MTSSGPSGDSGLTRTLVNWAGRLAANAAISITTRVVANLVSAAICRVRTDLNPDQQTMLRTYLESALNSFFNQRTNIRQQFRGILSIVCYDLPEENREHLIQQFREILRMYDWHGCLDDEPEPVLYGDDGGGVDGDESEDVLVRRLRISRPLAEQIPRPVRSALVAELTRTPPPTCSITLEEIVDDRGHIHADVVALVQKVGAGLDRDRFHVFLYKRAALERWFEVGGDVNPLTRERVHRSTQLFTLS